MPKVKSVPIEYKRMRERQENYLKEQKVDEILAGNGINQLPYLDIDIKKSGSNMF